MKLIKNYKKTLIALFTSLSISTTLIACTPNKTEYNSEEPNEKIENVEETNEQVENNKEVKDEVVDTESKEELISNDDEKTFSEKYFEELKEELYELKSDAKDKWDSEEVAEKRRDANQKFRELVDFIFNGKEINGMTFSELKDEEKEILMNEFGMLDEYIDDYIPDYKDRIKNWFSEKGPTAKEWLVDRGADLKELWTDYTNEVNEEYESRQMAKRI